MRIVKTGSYLPDTIVTNDDLAEYLDTSDEWIQKRTGIKKRHVAKGDSIESMAYKAVEDLFFNSIGTVVDKNDNSDLTDKVNCGETIDFIIVATMSHKSSSPGIANLIQARLGITQVFCLDISAACNGFIAALSVANGLLKTPTYGRGLVIGVEKMSDILDWTDRSTACLFGDGAGCVLVEASDALVYAESISSDGAHGEDLKAPLEQAKLEMNGRGIFNFVSREVPKNILSTISKAGQSIKAIDYVLAHQANKRLLGMISKKTGITEDKFLSNIDDVANTSAASIPLLLDKVVKDGIITLEGKQLVVFVGFGGGLNWGSIVTLV
ncbi:MAG: beta-ketoacyl-ACP synthase 3 [Bavariicoccus seileri]|uniref:Ketoacyl-ACP synthase III n=1 Tax=Bavariicoccus seileri TaxID=549685 RepID=A0A3D4S442_9ENTE|nr:beta-ketoacyl-ACP synthase 3 [Bavariicoccus seileri]HCS93589.1 ketoacyl-ACP synthase III [Bavariicoccus seileri]